MFPTTGDMKRIMLSFESRIDSEITFSLNSLLLYSSNQISPLLFEQYPQLLENITIYLEFLIKNISSLNSKEKLRSLTLHLQ